MVQTNYTKTSMELRPVVGDVDPVFKQVEGKVNQQDHDRKEWEENLHKAYRLRIRKKKVKTKSFPFTGASNIRMPTAEKNIRKVKAGILGIIFGTRPVVQAVPTPSGTLDGATRVEKFLDHLLMDVMCIQKPAETAVDQSLEKGMAFLKPYWRRSVIDREEIFNVGDLPLAQAISILRTPREQLIPQIIQRFDIDLHESVLEENLKTVQDKLDDILEGDFNITFNLKDVDYDFPAVDYVAPERVYVPTDARLEVQAQENITQEMFLPVERIKRDAERLDYSDEAVEKITKVSELDEKQIEKSKNEFEGIANIVKTGLVKVWETWGYFNIGGGIVKSFITSFPEVSAVAKKQKINTLSGKYPIVKLVYEINDDRWYSSRGIPLLLEDIIKEIDIQHNMKIDAQTIRNGPMFLYRVGAVDPNTIRMNPSGAIPVKGMQPLNDVVNALNFHNPNTEFSYDREQQLLNLEIQETVGQIDFSLQSVINKRQPRTLGEVEQQVASTGQVFNMDARHYIESFTELFNMVLELWSQFGPESYEFLYFGDSAQGESVKLSREEIQGKYTIKVRGNDQSLNPQVKINKANAILQASMSPIFLQSGIVGIGQLTNALKRYYQSLDVEFPLDLIDEQAEQKAQQAQQQEPDPMSMYDSRNFDELTEGEQAQIISKLGIQPDVSDRRRRQVGSIAEQAADIAQKVGDNGKPGAGT